MKKILLINAAILLFLILTSCDESINPNAPFRERYSLNGIIKSDTSFQVITLTHSYQPEDNNPLSYVEDPAITEAEVNVYYDNKLYRMRDTSIIRSDTTHYKTPLHFYYNSELKPGPNKTIEIDALLPNGILLQSVSTTPDVNSIGFFDYNSDKLIPPAAGSQSSVYWKFIPNILYDFKLFLKYQVRGNSEIYKKEVPIFYSNENNSLVPVYPIPTNEPKVTLDVETLTEFLDNLPEPGKTKKDYLILGIDIDVIVYDEYLSNYYYSVRQGTDGFTVKLDAPDYSNVKGGFGIFGSYVKAYYDLRIRADYLSTIGF
jgi:hypothetical protein